MSYATATKRTIPNTALGKPPIRPPNLTFKDLCAALELRANPRPTAHQLHSSLEKAGFDGSCLQLSASAEPTLLECKDESTLAKLLTTTLQIGGHSFSFRPMITIVPGLVYGAITAISKFNESLQAARQLLEAYGTVLSLTLEDHAGSGTFCSDRATFVLDLGRPPSSHRAM
jgi:hypothetical protein